MDAYVTLVMLGDEYVEPALALGESLLLTGTQKDRICMVTRDVSKAARSRLSCYWKLWDVDYIGRDRTTLPLLMSKTMNDIYGSWIHVSFTKWNCLKLLEAPFGYKKIVYMDADTVVLQLMDDMFDDRRFAVSSADPDYVVATSFFPAFRKIMPDAYVSHDLFKHVNKFETDRKSVTEMTSIDPRMLRDAYDVGLREAKERKRSFLLNTSMVYVERKLDLSSERYVARGTLFDSLTAKVTDEQNELFARGISSFPQGWDDQVFAQTLIERGPYVSMWHLRSMFNMLAGFYDFVNTKWPWRSLTWWGSKKPWNDQDNCPKYTDVIIWRYYHEKSVARLAE